MTQTAWNFTGLKPATPPQAPPTAGFDFSGLKPLAPLPSRPLPTTLPVSPAVRGFDFTGLKPASPVVPAMRPVPSHEPAAFDFSALKPVPSHEPAAAPVLAAAEPVAPGRTFLGTLADVGLMATRAAIGVPEAAVGLLDIPTGGRAGKLAERFGFRPKEAKAILDRYFSEQQQKANRTVAEAEGFVDTAVAALKNPSVIAQAVIESAPLMLGGAGIARQLVTRGVPAVVAAAAGEGIVSGGAAAEQIRQETPSGLLTPGQAGLAVTSGAATGGLALLGGRLAQRLGALDVDTLLAAGVKNPTARANLVKAVITSAVQEGVVEEFPQSILEQIQQNIATGKPWSRGVSQSAVLGALAGAVMGGGAQIAVRGPAQALQAAPREAEPTAEAPLGPPQALIAPPVAPGPAVEAPGGGMAGPTREAEILEPARRQAAAQTTDVRQQPVSVTPPPPLEPTDWVAQIQAKLAKGEPLGTLERRQDFAERQRVDAAREAAAKRVEAGLPAPGAEPAPAEAAPITVGEAVELKGRAGEPRPLASEIQQAILDDSELSGVKGRTPRDLGYTYVLEDSPLHKAFLAKQAPKAPKEAPTAPDAPIAIGNAVELTKPDGTLVRGTLFGVGKEAVSVKTAEGTFIRVKPEELRRPAREAASQPPAQATPESVTPPRPPTLLSVKEASSATPTRWRRSATPLERRIIFTPGALVEGGQARVISYQDPEPGRWSVTVEEVETGRRRTHATEPQVLKSTKAPPAARLAIRAGEYRNKPGFTVTGRNPAGRSVSIFVETREAAERVKARIAEGGEVTLEDMRVGLPAEVEPMPVPSAVAAAAESIPEAPPSAGITRTRTARAADTPAEAAAEVRTEVRRLVETKGAKSAVAVQQHVLQALESERATAATAVGFTTLTFDARKAYGGREGRILADGQAVADLSLTGATHTGSLAFFTEPELPKTTVKNGTPSEMRERALLAVAAELGRQRKAGTLRVEIPGDGIFTIERNPYAISELIRRIRSVGASAWRDLVVQEAKARTSPAALAGPRPEVTEPTPVAEAPPEAEEPEGPEGGTEAMALPSTRGRLLHDFPARPTPAATGEGPVKGPHDLVARLAALFQRPVATGKIRERALGIYRWQDKWGGKPEIVRVRVSNDLRVVFHEYGHHLDLAIMQGSKLNALNPIAQELKALGAPTSKPSYSPKKRRQEGAAEFFVAWMTAPETLAAKAPRYLVEFQRFLEDHPDLREGLEGLQLETQRYLSADPLTQAELHIDFGDSGLVRRVVETFAGSEEDPRTLWDKLNDSLNDDKLPYLRAEQQLRDGAPAPRWSESTYILQRLLAGTGEQAETYLSDAIRRPDGTIMAPGLFKALNPVMRSYKRFVTFMVGRRAQELHARNLETGLTDRQVAATQDVPAAQRQSFEKAAAASDAFFDGMLTWAVERGFLSGELATKFRQRNVFYVPFHRVATVAEGGTPGTPGTKRQNVAAFFKRFQGSGNRIQDPYITAIRNTHALVRLVEHNQSLRELVDLAAKTPGGARIAEHIDAKQLATRFNLAQVQREVLDALEQAGANIELPEGGLEDVDALLTVFTPATIAMGDTGVVTILRDGKREWWQIHDKALWETIVTKQPVASQFLLRLMKAGASSLRRLAVATLGFFERNLIRDHIDAKTKAHYTHAALDTLKSIGLIVRNTESWQLFKASKAAHAALVSPSVDVAKKQIRRLGHGPIRQMLDATIFHPLEAMEALSSLSDAAPRLQAFIKTVAEAERQGLDRTEALARGAFTAREITQDFTKMGSAVREANKYVAFLGARVGGWTRAGKALREDGWRYAARAFAYGVLPGLLLWSMNRDDPEYEEIPGWAKASYWHIPIPGSREAFGRRRYLWVPRPFDLGDIGNTLEAYLDWAVENDQAAIERLPWQSKTDAWQMLLGIMPTAVMPVLEIVANYDTFRNRTIVSPYDVDLPLEDQYSRWTSTVGKYVGPRIGLAPAHFDHLVYGYSGGYGRGVLEYVGRAVDAATPGGVPRPAQGWSSVPGVGTFYRGDVSVATTAASFQILYRRRDELAGVKRAIAKRRREKDQPGAEALARQHPQFEVELSRLNAAATLLAKIRREQVTPIYENRQMTPDEKRQALDRAYERMVQIARRALGREALPPRREGEDRRQ